ncbi:unnamed protein product [Prorocentrum cordatum]|uniref:Uncharacterized protein n=1 Tax=Prorocentrum cordatum TaxID=2364126 RepID=A0ABN9XHX9_9DINO|nr:unnamed protein product [Polarella glacialis]
MGGDPFLLRATVAPRFVSSRAVEDLPVNLQTKPTPPNVITPRRPLCVLRRSYKQGSLWSMAQGVAAGPREPRPQRPRGRCRGAEAPRRRARERPRSTRRAQALHRALAGAAEETKERELCKHTPVALPQRALSKERRDFAGGHA